MSNVDPSDHTESGKILQDRDGDLWQHSDGKWQMKWGDDVWCEAGCSPHPSYGPYTLYTGSHHGHLPRKLSESVEPSDHTESGKILQDRDGDLWCWIGGHWWGKFQGDPWTSDTFGPEEQDAPFTLYTGTVPPPEPEPRKLSGRGVGPTTAAPGERVRFLLADGDWLDVWIDRKAPECVQVQGSGAVDIVPDVANTFGIKIRGL